MITGTSQIASAMITPALAIAVELLTIAEAHGLASYALLGHQLLASAFLRRFDIAAADEQSRRAERLLRRMKLGIPILQQRSFESARLMLDGRFAEAGDKLAEIGALSIQWWAADALRTVQQAMLLYRSERWQDIPATLDTVAQVHPSLAQDLRVLLSTTGTGTDAATVRGRPSMGRDSPGLVVDDMHARPGRRSHRRRRPRGRQTRLWPTTSLQRRDSDQQR